MNIAGRFIDGRFMGDVDDDAGRLMVVAVDRVFTNVEIKVGMGKLGVLEGAHHEETHYQT
eukprot:2446985-Amphidinium_carterae.1